MESYSTWPFGTGFFHEHNVFKVHPLSALSMVSPIHSLSWLRSPGQKPSLWLWQAGPGSPVWHADFLPFPTTLKLAEAGLSGKC